MKNHVDTMIFRTAICFGAKANSFDGRCKSDICIASFATSCSEMRISMNKSFAVNLYKSGYKPERIAEMLEISLEQVMEWIEEN